MGSSRTTFSSPCGMMITLTFFQSGPSSLVQTDGGWHKMSMQRTRPVYALGPNKRKAFRIGRLASLWRSLHHKTDPGAGATSGPVSAEKSPIRSLTHHHTKSATPRTFIIMDHVFHPLWGDDRQHIFPVRPSCLAPNGPRLPICRCHGRFHGRFHGRSHGRLQRLL